MRTLLVIVAVTLGILVGCGNSEPTRGPDAGYCPPTVGGYVPCGHACCDQNTETCTSTTDSTCCRNANACGDTCCGAQEECVLGANGAGTCCNTVDVCHGLNGAVTCCIRPFVCNQNGTCTCPPDTTPCYGECCTATQTCDTQKRACSP